KYARHPSERDTISYISDNYDPLVASGQMTLLKGGEEILPGISVETFPGHTASMQGVIVNGRPGFDVANVSAAAAERRKNTAHGANRGSPEETAKAPEGRKTEATTEVAPSAPEPTTACYISDLIPTTAHVDITWGMSFDLYPLETIESKKRYYEKSIPNKWLTVFTHDPKTPWAYLEKDESGKMVMSEAQFNSQ